MNRRQFLEVVEESWRELDAAVAGLDEAILAEPGVVGAWSIADLLGHVTAWELLALQHMAQHARGEPLTFVSGPAVDDFNAAEAARRSGWALARVLAEQADTRERPRAAVEALSEEEWTAPAGAAGEALGAVVAGDLGGDVPGDHAAEHARAIRTWRAARADRKAEASP